MSQDYSRNGDEYQTAIAAAAFAIKSLEELKKLQPAIAAAALAIKSLQESENKARKRESKGPDTSLIKVQNKTQDIAREPEARTRSVKISDEALKTKSDVVDTWVPIRTETTEKVPEEAVGLALSIEKTPTLADLLNNTADSKPENAVSDKAIRLNPSMEKTTTFANHNFDSGAGRKPPPTKQAVPQAVETTKQGSTKRGSYYTEADEWEKDEMDKIKEKYEKLNATVLIWENNKKTKAKRRLGKIEAELHRKRAKAMQHYRDNVTRIDSMAGGARAQAVENQRNEEFKVKEKANKIRLTGKLPGTSLCF